MFCYKNYLRIHSSSYELYVKPVTVSLNIDIHQYVSCINYEAAQLIWPS
jgi:hypothetical protein